MTLHTHPMPHAIDAVGDAGSMRSASGRHRAMLSTRRPGLGFGPCSTSTHVTCFVETAPAGLPVAVIEWDSR